MNRAGDCMAYWRLHYHLVWATYQREPLIDSNCEAIIHRTLYGKAKELGVRIHAVGSVDDHVHVVASIPRGGGRRRAADLGGIGRLQDVASSVGATNLAHEMRNSAESIPDVAGNLR